MKGLLRWPCLSVSDPPRKKVAAFKLDLAVAQSGPAIKANVAKGKVRAKRRSQIMAFWSATKFKKAFQGEVEKSPVSRDGFPPRTTFRRGNFESRRQQHPDPAGVTDQKSTSRRVRIGRYLYAWFSPGHLGLLTFGVMVALIAAFLTNINHVGRLECPHECLHPWHDRQKS